MKKIICLYGQPGCGKTTQSNLLAKEFGFSEFGMGERLRAEIASGSELGQKIKPSVDAGVLIPDELMSEIIKEAGQDANDMGLIFDGFPRITTQADMLDEVLGGLELKVDAFIYLHLSAEDALARIKSRAALAGGTRGDDTDENAIKNRFGVFEKQSVPLLDLYRKRGLLQEIDGSLPIPEVYNLVKKALGL